MQSVDSALDPPVGTEGKGNSRQPGLCPVTNAAAAMIEAREIAGASIEVGTGQSQGMIEEAIIATCNQGPLTNISGLSVENLC